MRIFVAIVVLLLASPAYGATRVVGYVTINGQRVLVVKQTPTKRRQPVVYDDPLDKLWRTSPGGDKR